MSGRRMLNPLVVYWLPIHITPTVLLVFSFLGEFSDRSNTATVASLVGVSRFIPNKDWGTCHDRPGGMVHAWVGQKL